MIAGKKINELIPTAKPILKTVALMLYWFDILNKPEKISNTIEFTRSGAEKWFHSGRSDVITRYAVAGKKFTRCIIRFLLIRLFN